MGTGYIIRRGLATCDSAPEETDGFSIKFFDYDGTLLQETKVDSDGSVTAPTAPNHTNIGLTFDSWTHATTNVTNNMNVGATYTTTDGKSHFGLRFTVATGKNVLLYINKSDGSTLTIDWGDSTSNDFTNTGNFNTGHTYATYGDYEVKMWISTGSGTYGFGEVGASATTTVVGGNTQAQRDMLLYAFVGENVTDIGVDAFYYCSSLTNIVIPDSVTSISGGAFHGCSSLTNIVIPDSVTDIGDSAFQYCYSLTNIVIPNSVTDIGDSAFNYCPSLTNIVIPSSVTSIGSNALQACFSLTTYIFERTAGITAIASTNTFAGINSVTKIYVPDDLVSTYKSAANWSTYANYIYPISEKGVTHND